MPLPGRGRGGGSMQLARVPLHQPEEEEKGFLSPFFLSKRFLVSGSFCSPFLSFLSRLPDTSFKPREARRLSASLKPVPGAER